ncbi:hypothetical protein DQ384_36735 [Sphaerisporangium album]|uniref:ANTAR domain-containing protein n=1 Tax=Sphaerisporangium album TaxID=509200 RepID=A0A367EVH1_9ACTN|nr:hypothetical protein [Sphaerisporangium album]RCG21160.1 hypothetical protein DQ384_36735 [Sphaerisporangium album]
MTPALEEARWLAPEPGVPDPIDTVARFAYEVAGLQEKLAEERAELHESIIRASCEGRSEDEIIEAARKAMTVVRGHAKVGLAHFP